MSAGDTLEWTLKVLKEIQKHVEKDSCYSCKQLLKTPQFQALQLFCFYQTRNREINMRRKVERKVQQTSIHLLFPFPFSLFYTARNSYTL